MGDCYDPGPRGRGRWFSFETYQENPNFRRSDHPRNAPPELLSTLERLRVEGG